MSTIDWNEETKAELRRLWEWRGPGGEQYSTEAIGVSLGISKNAAVGKAHRLKLEPRPSPIRYVTGAPKVRDRPQPPERAGAVTLPALPSAPTIVSVPRPVVVIQPLPPLSPSVAAPKPVVVAPLPKPATMVFAFHRPASECAWPIGDPKSRAFRYCDAPTEPGRPYCTDHCGQSYNKVETVRFDKKVISKLGSLR